MLIAVAGTRSRSHVTRSAECVVLRLFSRDVSNLCSTMHRHDDRERPRFPCNHITDLRCEHPHTTRGTHRVSDWSARFIPEDSDEGAAPMGSFGGRRAPMMRSGGSNVPIRRCRPNLVYFEGVFCEASLVANRQPTYDVPDLPNVRTGDGQGTATGCC